ncbi:MAG: TlpA disulfide reductase family protein [Planctomycetota bacterium]|nr:TlpA disulfide reductase family protein [Planctomycetota bacterium]
MADRQNLRTGWLVAAGLLLSVAGGVSSAHAMEPRQPTAIVAEFEGVKAPEFDQSKQSDQAYIQKFITERNAAMKKRADLALELFKADPTHAKVRDMMRERWRTLRGIGELETALKETADIAAGTGDLAQDATFSHASLVLAKNRGTGAEAQKAVDAAIAKFPKDERGASLLMQFNYEKPADELAAMKRVVKDWPGSRAAKQASGKVRQADGVGKPFEIKFTDAITGKDTTLQKGTVYIIDFWATWCGPCVAEMPEMKKIYSEFKGQGVEFIGVSLDAPESEGGLKELKEFVKENEIAWPQYYQGKGWESEFSGSWGINAIPAIFAVDHQGNLYSTEARGKVEEIIKEMIAKRDGKSSEDKKAEPSAAAN